MALCGSGLKFSLESIGVGYYSTNSSTRLHRSSGIPLSQRKYSPLQQKCWRIRCSTSRKSTLPMEAEENVQSLSSVSMKEELEHVIKFKISDFKISNSVSVGLEGRADEVVFEATVKDSQSPLYNTRVVLRRLISAQAMRRGKRAIEVLKRLARRRLMYHSYSMQVHGYVSLPSNEDGGSFTLVHGYHGSFSLRHWLQLSDWLPTLEATLAMDEESVRRVGDDTVGGPTVSRQLRIIRILMRDLLIGVNYLHSHGLAHTELRLENVHISPVDRHIKVGILGNAADFYDSDQKSSTLDSNMERRQMMIAFDIRCVGFMMAKMVLRELMDPTVFAKFKSFLTKGNDPTCMREFLLQILNRSSSSGNAGLQILDRNWGAGWNLLSSLLATKSSKRIRSNNHIELSDVIYKMDGCKAIYKGISTAGETILGDMGHSLLYAIHPSRITHRTSAHLEVTTIVPELSCLDALRHPFLCGPRWRVNPSMDIIRWGLGSTAVRITEEYIYHLPQRSRVAHFIELMELLNPHPRPRNWLVLLPGKWRLLYSTGRHIGLTLRQPSARVLIGDVYITVSRASALNTKLSFTSGIGFRVIVNQNWPHDKSGTSGELQVNAMFRLTAGRRLYFKEDKTTGKFPSPSSGSQDSVIQKLSSRQWKETVPFKDFPTSIPVANLTPNDVEMTMRLDDPLSTNVETARNVIQEIRTQIPPEIFDLSKIVCGTYLDPRLLVLRGVNGSALLFTRSCE